MKRTLILLMAVIPLLTACASSSNVINDDAYYSPYDNKAQYEKTLVTANYGYFDSEAINGVKEVKYTKSAPVDTIIAVVDTVYIIEVPTSNVTIEIGTGIRVGFGIGVGLGWGLYSWDPFWDPYWYPSYYPYYRHYWSWAPYYWAPYYPYYYSYSFPFPYLYLN